MTRTEEKLLAHLRHHYADYWINPSEPLKSLLLAGAYKEDANTIRNAIENISEGKLVRRLAHDFHCDRNVEAIQKAVMKTSKDQLDRCLARALADE